MPLPNSIGAYRDCFDVFEKAEADSHGARVQFASHGEAKTFQVRMNHARQLQRQESTLIYDRTHPLYNTCSFDEFQVRAPVEDEDGKWWVYIERRGHNILAIEALSTSAEEAT